MADTSSAPVGLHLGRWVAAMSLVIVLSLAGTSQGYQPVKASPAVDDEPAKPAAKNLSPRAKKLTQMVQDVLRQVRADPSKDSEDTRDLLFAALVQALDPNIEVEVRQALVKQLQAAVRDLEKAALREAPLAPPAATVPFQPAPNITGPPVGFATPRPGSQRAQFKFDANTPLEKLLPIPPKSQPTPVLAEDIAQVPEVMFEEPFAKKSRSDLALQHIAHNLAKIDHLNKKKTDAFMAALIKRPDLAGLPFAMGDACRLKEEQSKLFTQALNMIRSFLAQNINVSITDAETAPQRAAEAFWDNLQNNWQVSDRNARHSPQVQEHVIAARIAALMQVCGPLSLPMRKGLVSYLASASHVDATRDLAKLAIFSAEEEVRLAAVSALKVRREKDYTDILVQGLRYPLPAVAKRAGEALVKLERKDLIPELVAFLDEPDPRVPQVKKVADKDVTVMREVVKINHHRNCLMCHAPGQSVQGTAPILVPPSSQVQFRSSEVKNADGTTNTVVLVSADPIPPPLPKEKEPEAQPLPALSPEIPQGSIPIPGEPLPSPQSGYQTGHPDILVRVDVTYLRQDFSLLLPVADALPWPEKQRFDFLVRNRVLSDKEAKTVHQSLKNAGTRPYQQVAQMTLQALTGRNAAPNADAWRQVLGLQAPAGE